MAITRAQQYQQLVNPPMEGKKRPGYRGDDAAFSTGAAQMGRADPRTSSSYDGPRGPDDSGGRDDVVTEATLRRNQIALDNAEYKRGKKQLDNLKIADTKFPGFFPGSTFLNIGLGATTKFRQKMLDKNVDYFKNLSGIENKGYSKTAEGYREYMSDRLAGKIDAAGNRIMGGDDDDDNIILPVDTTFNMASSNMDQETDTTEEKPFMLARAFRAEGGIMNSDVVGGEFDFESARQMYGLGKLVKKVTRTVKKIAKSPIGKAALLYAGTAGLGSLATGGGMGSLFRLGTYAPSSVAANFPAIFTKAGAKNILFGGEKLLGNPAKGNLVPFSGIFGSGGKMSAIKAIGLTSAAAGLLTPEQEDEAQTLADNTGIDIEKARNSILAARREQYAMDARARGFKADGGLMRLGYQEGGDAEPVAKKTMPLLDMDGKEKDYRETGGFVDMGRMERADDVPARLSKNEFVFTADAVRNAGDGSVDKGAEVMYNMMKNLEAGGEVSEESQGLEGARKMFQTSQRLEEVL